MRISVNRHVPQSSLSCISALILSSIVLASCAGPAQTFEYDEPDIGAASSANESVQFADILVSGSIRNIGFLDIRPQNPSAVAAEFYHLPSQIDASQLKELENQLALPADRACRLLPNNSEELRGGQSANLYDALSAVGGKSMVQGAMVLNPAISSASITIYSDAESELSITPLQSDMNSDGATRFIYSVADTNALQLDHSVNLSISGFQTFPSLSSVFLDAFQTLKSVRSDASDSDGSMPVSGSVITWNANSQNQVSTIGVSFIGDGEKPILCSAEDTGTVVVPETVSQVASFWSDTSVSVTRSRLLATQQDDTLLIIKISAVARL